MAQRDLYEVLELPRSASAAEIKKAYKRLARKLHPDLNPGDKSAEDRFKEINEAYAVLSSPEKKKQYDTYGTAGPAPPPDPGVHFEGFDFGAGPSPAGGFEDLFETFAHAAQRPQARGPLRGEDLIYPITLSLAEAFSGKKSRLAISHTVPCDRCHGEGRLSSSRKKPCPRCGGKGRVGVARGPFSFQSTCDLCGGLGKDPGDACPSCGGAGSKEVSDTVDVAIPAGVDTGSRVRLKGKGQAGHLGGPQGDLYIETHILPHAVFLREGPNLKVRVPITFPEAALGARVDVPTLGGGARLKIPPGTSSGQTFRLKGRGMPSLRGAQPGDLLVEVTVAVPAIVDEKSKELLREFERLNPENPRGYTSVAPD
jgi:molecular chaperone DnaJ